ncbi:Proline-rich protein PRCC [Dillenia turbinata]|uniref:Proline-rich protein PRCC n=1 Tax=Dillenia turbinata TaxID=194707 RepID=A0AAN8W7G9_9MAGN
MDSLLANYASSDEEEDAQQQQTSTTTTTTKLTAPASSSLFSSLPKPSFLSLPTPKKNNLSSSLPKFKEEEEEEQQKPPKTSSSSIFSSLPKPKTQSSTNFDQFPKRVVQFNPPPIIPSSLKAQDSDDEEEHKARKNPNASSSSSSAQNSSVSSFLSSIPAPKNSGPALGSLPSSGSGRRAVVETDLPASTNDSAVDTSETSYGANWADGSSSASYGPVDLPLESYSNSSDADKSNLGYVGADYENYDYRSYENYGNYGYHENNLGGGTQESGVHVDVVMGRKRGRNEVPAEIIEVKQDELMKNRPREDQAKLTGIAFGPSYQPVSTKGKPSKLHKRKHQIGSLYHDMKQKEMELQERRARGFLTKAETQAKYGW